MDYANNPFFRQLGPAGYYNMAFNWDHEERKGPGLQPDTETHRHLAASGFFQAPGVRDWVESLNRPMLAPPPADEKLVRGVGKISAELADLSTSPRVTLTERLRHAWAGFLKPEAAKEQTVAPAPEQEPHRPAGARPYLVTRNGRLAR